MQLIPVATKMVILQPNIGVNQGIIPSSDEKMQVEIERRLDVTISKLAKLEHCLKYLWISSLALPLGKAIVLLPRLHQVLA
jgi:hypothetical protein